MTLKDKLSGFYEKYNLPEDGGVHDRMVELQIFKGFSLYFPNFEKRRQVIDVHDAHHLLTGYGADIEGECQISAWEIASGCHHNWQH